MITFQNKHFLCKVARKVANIHNQKSAYFQKLAMYFAISPFSVLLAIFLLVSKKAAWWIYPLYCMWWTVYICIWWMKLLSPASNKTIVSFHYIYIIPKHKFRTLHFTEKKRFPYLSSRLSFDESSLAQFIYGPEKNRRLN